jgi:hypothetical protein
MDVQLNDVLNASILVGHTPNKKQLTFESGTIIAQTIKESTDLCVSTHTLGSPSIRRDRTHLLPEPITTGLSSEKRIPMKT